MRATAVIALALALAQAGDAMSLRKPEVTASTKLDAFPALSSADALPAEVLVGGTFQTKRAAFFTLKKSQQTGWPAVAARSRQPAEKSRQLAEMSGQLAEMSWQAAGRKSEIRLFSIRKKSDFRLSVGSFLAGFQDISAGCRDISAGCQDLVASCQGVPGWFAPP